MLQRLMIPLIALIFAGATAYIARNWIEEKDTKPAVATAAPVPEVKYKKVLVASSALGIGSFVKPDSLEWQKWPDVDVPDSYFVEGERSKTELDGAVVRLPIVVGEPITEGSMVKPGDRGFLAVVLDPDMRAVSIPVDEASSNAGLISPGDRVDVILTQNVTVKGPKDEDIARRVSETVLQDVKVIAMGRQMDPAGLSLPDQQGRNSNGQARTTTLEVTPRGAELVAVATELGKISLSLRSLASRRTPEDRVVSSVPTWDSDVSHALQPTNGKSSELVVIRGSSSSSVDVPAGTGK
ncbi:MAG: Flp pilus assembly protein CpaB [Geminicoccaceae bacterium]